MKVKVTKEEFIKLVEQMLKREILFNKIYRLGLGGLVEDLRESDYGEKSLLTGLMEAAGMEDEFTDDVYGGMEFPTVDYIVKKILGRISYRGMVVGYKRL